MDSATRWGLPAGFVPLRNAVSDEVKNAVRAALLPSEPVVVTLANEANNVALVATPQRLFAIRSGTASAGATGFSIREYPWHALTRLTMQQASNALKFSIAFKSSDGKTVAIGRRAALAREATDHFMPFEPTTGHAAFAAFYQIWEHQRSLPAPEIIEDISF